MGSNQGYLLISFQLYIGAKATKISEIRYSKCCDCKGNEYLYSLISPISAHAGHVSHFFFGERMATINARLVIYHFVIPFSYVQQQLPSFVCLRHLFGSLQALAPT